MTGWRRVVGATLGPLALAFSVPAPAAAAEFEACRAAALDAQRLRAEQHLLEERQSLLSCLDPTCPEVIQASCREWLDANDAARPSIVLTAQDSLGNDLLGARYAVDGSAEDRPVNGNALEVDPGQHRVRGTAPGMPPQEIEILVAVGVKRRPVSLVWQRPHPQVAPTARNVEAIETRPVPPQAWILGAASSLALATAGVFGALAWQKYGDLHAHHLGDQQPLPTYRVAGDVSLGIGVVVGAIAVWTYLARPTVRSEPRDSLRGAYLRR